MPGYIGFTPQFNPISLQEYLTVPTMLQQEFDTYEEKYNENLDKLAALEGMLDESTKDYLNPYKSRLQNAADIISGKTGNLGSLRQQTAAARQFYREYAPKLTNAYNKRQQALKTQQEILLKDPSAVTTQVGNMQSFIENPDQTLHSLSGDKVYSDMINAGKLSAADITSIGKAGIPGYLAQRTGYTLEEQKQYADLVRQALSGNAEADNILRSNPIYAQPYQVLSKYIEDNKFNLFDDSQQAYAFNRALSGQLMGMSGDVKYLADKQWEQNADFNNWKRKQQYIADHTPKDDDGDNPVTRLPRETSSLEGGTSKASKYHEFKTLFDEIKRDPSILKAQEPRRNLGIDQAATAESSEGIIYKTNPNYAKEKAKYDKRKKYEKLLEEVKKDYPNLNYDTWVSLGTNELGIQTPILNYDIRIDDITADLAERTAGFTFNTTKAANEQILADVKRYANIQDEGENDLIRNNDRRKTKAKNKDLQDITADNTQITVEDNIVYMKHKGKVYILEPGAFGVEDPAMREALDELWENGQFDLYTDRMTKYLKLIADEARRKAKGQSNTDSKLED